MSWETRCWISVVLPRLFPLGKSNYLVSPQQLSRPLPSAAEDILHDLPRKSSAGKATEMTERRGFGARNSRFRSEPAPPYTHQHQPQGPFVTCPKESDENIY